MNILHVYIYMLGYEEKEAIGKFVSQCCACPLGAGV